jgi:hypothetical protein
MKIATITLLVFLIFIACNRKTNSDGQDEKSIAVLPFPLENNPLEGVWKFTIAYSTAYGDTIYIQDDQDSHKIFYGDYFMWIAEPSKIDSTEWYAFGKYEVKKSTLLQTVISGSENAKIFLSSNEFTIRIEPDLNAYVQSMEVNYSDTTFLYEENWKRLR